MLKFLLFLTVSTIMLALTLGGFIGGIVLLASFIFWEAPGFDLGVVLGLTRATLSVSFLISFIYAFTDEGEKEWRV